MTLPQYIHKRAMSMSIKAWKELRMDDTEMFQFTIERWERDYVEREIVKVES